ncbi:MAG: asparaginase [Clostridia bacterium]|nr:asparaginase [Clostridia bacterium]
MKAIKMIFTGGTIGSTLEEGVICPDGGKPRALLEAYKVKCGVDLTQMADCSEPYTILSENLDGEVLYKLMQEVAGAIKQGYRGILITHGTDTLQYTAAALGYAFGLCGVPIVLVSSNYPIEHPRANGVENLQGAVTWIQKQHTGVWVAYKNEGAVLQIHRATRLLAHKQSSDTLDCLGCGNERKDEIAPLYPTNGLPTPNILRIQPYPGMTYPALTPHIQGVIHETYHSGTLNLKEAAPFFRQAQELGIPVYVTGTTEGAIYESARDFAQYGLRLLPGRSAIAAYMKLWLTLSCGRNPDDTMEAALGGDI